MNPTQIAQTFLKTAGFYTGQVDGQWGPLSEHAAAAWQASLVPAPALVLSVGSVGSVGSDPSVPSAPGSLVIGADGWLVGVRRKPLPASGRTLSPIGLIMHATCGDTVDSSIDGEPSGVGAHFYVERDGGITQACSCLMQIGHAGFSTWKDPVTGDQLHNLNSYTLGIEIANAEDEALAWARKQPGFTSIQARHPNGGPVQEWECYPAAQIAAVIALTQAIIVRFPLHFIAGHEQIAPDRRNDPGPAFPWEEFRKAVNFFA